MEEVPQEDDVDGSVMAEDNRGFCGNDAVSSIAASPELILIPAPVRTSMHNQQAVKGHGTKDHPYELDFAPAVHSACRLSPETCCKQRDH